MPRRRDESESEAESSEEEAPRGKKKAARKSTAQPTQAKKRPRKSQRPASDDDDDAEDGSHKAKAGGLAAGAVDEKAAQLVRLALFYELQRKPIKRDDVTKQILGKASRSFPAVFKRAQEILGKTFGYELVELRPKGENQTVRDAQTKLKDTTNKKGKDDTAAAKAKPKSAPTKQFILRSKLPASLLAAAADPIQLREDNNRRPDDELADEDIIFGNGAPETVTEWKADKGEVLDWKTGDQRPLMGMLHVILALILVNERCLTQGSLLKHLERLGIDAANTLPHNPSALHADKEPLRNYLQTLLNHNYLERTDGEGKNANHLKLGPNHDDDGVVYEWRWGARSEAEIGEATVAEFVVDLMATPIGGDDEQTEEEQEKLRETVLKAVKSGAGTSLQDARAGTSVADD